MQQIYRRAPMLCNFIEITVRHGCFPVNLLHIFRTTFLRTPLDGCFWSSQLTFQWKTHCFFCNENVTIDDSEHKNRCPESHRAGGKGELVQLIHKFRERCDERNNKCVKTAVYQHGPCC